MKTKPISSQVREGSPWLPETGMTDSVLIQTLSPGNSGNLNYGV